MKEANDSKFVTRKWNIDSDNSNANYDVGNEIIYHTEILKSDIWDYSDVYTLGRCDISIIGDQATQVAFNNCAPLAKCISKTDKNNR